jgi:hypothetical protein
MSAWTSRSASSTTVWPVPAGAGVTISAEACGAGRGGGVARPSILGPGAIIVRRGVSLRDGQTTDLERVRPVTSPPRAGVTVELAPPDPTRPLLASCPVCRRPVLFGELTGAGTWVTLLCRHCRVVLRVASA